MAEHHYDSPRSYWLLAAAPVLLGVLAVCSGLAVPARAQADRFDWPNWRGPQQNNVSTETGLIESWDLDGGEGSNLLWKNEELAGISTPIVLAGKLYMLVRDQPASPNEGEKVVCVDTTTGNILWEHRFNAYLTEVPDFRLGWSSCVADPKTGRVYAQGVCGYFCCLEGDTGELVWSRSLHEEFGLLSTYGGRTNFPVILDDTVITSAIVIGWGDTEEWGSLAKPAHRFMAFDKATGELRWMNGTRLSPYDTNYSTPTIKVLGKQAAMVFGSGDGAVWAFQPRTGQPIWKYQFSRRGLNVSPLVDAAGRVFMSHSEENVAGNTMGSLIALDGLRKGDLTGTELWRQFEVMAGKSSPIEVDGRLYVIDDGAKLHVFDAATGERIARKALGTAMRGTPLYADGKIYTCTSGGRWYILRPTTDGVEIIHRVRLRNESVDASPIVSRGRIFLATSRNLYCLGKSNHEPTAETLPVPDKEPPVDEDATPDQMLVVPCDVLLAPGQEQAYRVRLYNSRGQFLREALPQETQFAVVGPGTISADGTFAAPQETGHECALVKCEIGKLSASARVRIVPPLPWSFDFDETDDVPLTWVGGRVRHVVRDVDGERVIAKRNVLPIPRDPNNKLGTRSRTWMGPIDLADYTVQADVQLGEEDGKLPDAGLVNSGYTLTIRGQTGQLRLYNWDASDFRKKATTEFDAEPGVWYTMKLSVVPADRQASVRGKIWKRGEAEPKEWILEYVDHSPNLAGSPGLFGNAYDAEFYLDNIEVSPN